MAKTPSRPHKTLFHKKPNKTAMVEPKCSVSPETTSKTALEPKIPDTAPAAASGPKSPKSSKALKHPKHPKNPLSRLLHFLTSLPRRFITAIKRLRTKYRTWRGTPKNPHKSFRRSYREDYLRPTETPGLLVHAISTFAIIKKHWRTFLPFVFLMVISYIILVGLMSEDYYLQLQDSVKVTETELARGEIGNFARSGLLLLSTITTGGLDSGMDEVGTVFMIILFIIMWLVTIFLLRHYFAGSKPRLRDALYNSLTPLVSSLIVFAIAFVQAIPLMLVAITYSAARITDFLSTPFYALVYFIFAALMILLSVYLLSSSLLALVAVSAPGVYPLVAVASASDLIAGRRVHFLIRILYLVVIVVFIFMLTMLPVIFLDLWLKSIFDWLGGIPVVPFCLLTVTCFVFIYATAYLYRYYRWLLDYREK